MLLSKKLIPSVVVCITLTILSLISSAAHAVTVTVADLRADYDTPPAAYTDGAVSGTGTAVIPDTLGSGNWKFYGSDTATPSSGTRNPLTYETSPNGVRNGNEFVYLGQALDLPAISNIVLISGGGQGTLNANELGTHPGVSPFSFVVARWTSGIAGTVDISGTFAELGSTANGVTREVFHNTTSIVPSLLHTSVDTRVAFGPVSRTVAIGDTIDVFIGSNGEISADHSALSVLITMEQAEAVPEPSTLVLAALGLAGLGLVAWRRKK